MLKRCSSAFLLTSSLSLEKEYRTIAKACDVSLTVETDWNERYRITQDCIITDAQMIGKINKVYYAITSLVLTERETFLPYMESISRFIFDATDARELMFAFLLPAVRAEGTELSLSALLEQSNTSVYTHGSYDFHFEQDRFLYKGRAIYLTQAQKKFLANWLLYGKKDNTKRMYICTMRKGIGKDFLSDIDMVGHYKGVDNE